MRSLTTMFATLLALSLPCFGASEVQNLGIANAPHSYPGMQASERYLAFVVFEYQQSGADLNGDGDALDEVLHIYDARTGALINLGVSPMAVTKQIGGVASWSIALFALVDDLVVAVTPESENGVDYNADGDLGDRLTFVHDLRTGRQQFFDVQLEPGFIEFSDSISGTGRWFLFQRTEQTTIFVFDRRTWTLTDLGLRGTGVVFEGRALISALESVDLNGDGDTSDTVLQRVDFANLQVMNLGLAGEPVERTGLLRIDELQQGADVNGDGRLGQVLFADTAAGPASLDVTVNWPVPFPFVSPFAFPADPEWYPVLGADADTGVTMPWSWRANEQRIEPLPIEAGVLLGTGRDPEAGNHYLVQLDEESVSGDLNGDGDALDAFVRVYDERDGSDVRVPSAVAQWSPFLTNPARDFWVRVEGRYAALSLSEADSAATDLNGDGDATDRLLVVIDLRTGTVLPLNWTEIEPRSFDLVDGVLWALRPESETGDRNGDGDALDWVLHSYDIHSGTTTNHGLACLGSSISQRLALVVRDRRASVYVLESDQGGQDLNGDGDAQDVVLHVVR